MIQKIGSLILIMIFSISCNKSNDSGTQTKGTVKLQMDNVATLMGHQLKTHMVSPKGTCPAGLTCITPDKFEMKILAAYVVEDIDSTTSNNVGQVGMVWLNPGCTEINGCQASSVEYSDLTDPTQFNSLLNSQALEINTGTYKYVRLEFCQGSADVDNVRITSGASVLEFTYGGCGVTSVQLNTPVTLEEGDNITISVSYDLSDGEAYYVPSSSCPDANNFCLGGIDLEPSIVQ